MLTRRQQKVESSFTQERDPKLGEVVMNTVQYPFLDTDGKPYVKVTYHTPTMGDTNRLQLTDISYANSYLLFPRKFFENMVAFICPYNGATPSMIVGDKLYRLLATPEGHEYLEKVYHLGVVQGIAPTAHIIVVIRTIDGNLVPFMASVRQASAIIGEEYFTISFQYYGVLIDIINRHQQRFRLLEQAKEAFAHGLNKITISIQTNNNGTYKIVPIVDRREAEYYQRQVREVDDREANPSKYKSVPKLFDFGRGVNPEVILDENANDFYHGKRKQTRKVKPKKGIVKKVISKKLTKTELNKIRAKNLVKARAAKKRMISRSK